MPSPGSSEETLIISPCLAQARFCWIILSFLGQAAAAAALELHFFYIPDALKSQNDMWMLSRAYTERQRPLKFSDYSRNTIVTVDEI